MKYIIKNLKLFYFLLFISFFIFQMIPLSVKGETSKAEDTAIDTDWLEFLRLNALKGNKGISILIDINEDKISDPMDQIYEQNGINTGFLLLQWELYKYKETINDPDLFIKLAHNNNVTIAGASIRILGYLNLKNSGILINEVLKNTQNEFLIESAIIALGSLKDEAFISTITSYLSKDCRFLKKTDNACLRALSEIGGTKALDAILTYINCEHLNNKKSNPYYVTAIKALGRFVDYQKAAKKLNQIMIDISAPCVCRVNTIIALLLEEKGRQTLMQILDDIRDTQNDSCRLRESAINGFGEIRDYNALPILTKYLNHKDDRVRKAAINASEQIKRKGKNGGR